MAAFERILFVGCGNMGGAMLDGWLAGGLEPSRFTIVSPNRAQAPAGVRLLRSIPEEKFDAIVLGVKPHMLGRVAADVAKVAGADTAILSILAGVTLDDLRDRFPRAGSVVRIMPNLAVALGKSPLALVADGPDGSGPDSSWRRAFDNFLAPLGTPEWLPDETQYDLVTALAGSGPAFLYRFIDALGSAGRRLGLESEQADRLALATVEGAAALAASSPHDPAALADRVASPGGMTREGLDVLDAGDALIDLLTRTLQKARDRGAELAEQARAADG